MADIRAVRAFFSQQPGSNLRGGKQRCTATCTTTCTATYHIHMSSSISQIPFAKKQLAQVPALQPCASLPEECRVALASPIGGNLNRTLTSHPTHMELQSCGDWDTWLDKSWKIRARGSHHKIIQTIWHMAKVWKPFHSTRMQKSHQMYSMKPA